MLIDLNLWHDKIISMIFDAQDESDFDDERYGDDPQITTPLLLTRDYPFGQFNSNTDGISYSILKVKDVSISYDGTNYYRALPMDLTEYDLGNAPSGATAQDAFLDNYFAKTAPRYDLKNNALWLYPLASQTDINAGGQLVMEFFRSGVPFTSAELSAGTVSPGTSPSFHAMYAYGPAFEYCEAKQLPQRLEIYRELQAYEDRLKSQYSSKSVDRKYALKSAPVNYK